MKKISRQLVAIFVAIFVLGGCASCKWCKDSCKRTEYVDKAVNVYAYPSILNEPMVRPDYEPVSPELDAKLRGLIDLLKAIDADRGKCVSADASICDRTSVSDDLMAQMQETLVTLNTLYFKEQTIHVSNLGAAISYYSHLEWRVKNYEEQILDIMAREAKDPDSLVKPK